MKAKSTGARLRARATARVALLALGWALFLGATIWIATSSTQVMI